MTSRKFVLCDFNDHCLNCLEIFPKNLPGSCNTLILGKDSNEFINAKAHPQTGSNVFRRDHAILARALGFVGRIVRPFEQ